MIKKLGFLVLIIIAVLFTTTFSTHRKVLLFLFEEFSQSRFRPLLLFSNPPVHKKLSLPSANGKIVVDLLIPNQKAPSQKPAIIIAMGIRAKRSERPALYHPMDTMARLGYVVAWPRLEALDKEKYLPEVPETFVTAFDYLTKQPFVDNKRISFLGVSTGSSTAFVALADPQLSNRARALVFFGGYYDIFVYLRELVTKTMVIDGRIIPWDLDPGVHFYTKNLIREKRAGNLLKIFQSPDKASQILTKLPQKEASFLRQLNPAEYNTQFKTPIFILHSKADRYVAYAQSIELAKNVPAKLQKGFLLTSIFDHVRPNNKFDWFAPEAFVEFTKIYAFMFKVFYFL